MQLYKNFSPIVSVILPTYNRAALLERSINSVINQSFSEWELLVVDDGSNDNTFEVIKKFQEKLINIRYLRHSNRKLPITLNIGIQASCGKFITFLGSDDEYLPSHLQLRIEYLRNNQNVDLIHGGVKIIGNPFVKDKEEHTKKIHLRNCVIGGTFLGKRSLFVQLNGFKNIHYSEDSEFFERAKKLFNIHKVDFPTYIYHRETKGSITNSI